MHSVHIVNLSRHPGLTSELVARMTIALAKQAAEHVAPLWDIVPPALSFGETPAPGSAPLVIFDTAEQAGFLGYHSVGPDGVPYGRVFIATILGHGGTLIETANSVSVTLSHEWLEMLGDPACNEWCDANDGYTYAEELCDAVEAQAYDIDGIMVSNFVTPLWFEPFANAAIGRFDYLSRLTAPFQLDRGGYAIRRPLNGGPVENVWGAEYPEHKRAGKLHPAARTARRAAT